MALIVLLLGSLNSFSGIGFSVSSGKSICSNSSNQIYVFTVICSIIDCIVCMFSNAFLADEELVIPHVFGSSSFSYCALCRSSFSFMIPSSMMHFWTCDQLGNAPSPWRRYWLASQPQLSNLYCNVLLNALTSLFCLLSFFNLLSFSSY